MRLRSWKITRLAVVTTLGGALAIAGVTGGALAATAAPVTTAAVTPVPPTTVPALPGPPVVAGSGYLALGDSVTFGYREADTKPAPNYKDARSFVGYPEDVGAALGLHVANPACPGETSASLIHTSARSNGCLKTATGTPGYRAAFPLHVSYSGSQLSYAVAYLKAHPGVRVVSLMIGANDGLLCQETTKDHCQKELPAVLKKIAANVHVILATIRSKAGYEGQVVIVNYYSTNYTSLVDNLESQALNQALDTAAKPFGVKVANGYQAFRSASIHSGLNPCKAGLLTQLTNGTCGIHPSAAGSDVLALAVERVLAK
jgi:lysophospholipase L1-like esterase